MLYLDSLLVHLSVEFCVESIFRCLIMFQIEHSYGTLQLNLKKMLHLNYLPNTEMIVIFCHFNFKCSFGQLEFTNLKVSAVLILPMASWIMFQYIVIYNLWFPLCLCVCTLHFFVVSPSFICKSLYYCYSRKCIVYSIHKIQNQTYQRNEGITTLTWQSCNLVINLFIN